MVAENAAPCCPLLLLLQGPVPATLALKTAAWLVLVLLAGC
jgi:hypothetical protein